MKINKTQRYRPHLALEEGHWTSKNAHSFSLVEKINKTLIKIIMHRFKAYRFTHKMLCMNAL